MPVSAEDTQQIGLGILQRIAVREKARLHKEFLIRLYELPQAQDMRPPMLNRKLFFQLVALTFACFSLCSCTKVMPAEQHPRHHFQHVTTDEFLQANIHAQEDQDARVQKKSDELDKMHVTGGEKARQLAIEKVAAHKDFLARLNENKREVIEGITQRPQK